MNYITISAPPKMGRTKDDVDRCASQRSRLDGWGLRESGALRGRADRGSLGQSRRPALAYVNLLTVIT